MLVNCVYYFGHFSQLAWPWSRLRNRRTITAQDTRYAYINVAYQCPERRYFSVREAAAYLGLSPKTVYAWAEQHVMPAYKLGRVWRFDKAELDDFVRRRTGNGFV